MSPTVKAFWASLLITVASLSVLIFLAFEFYGEHANLSAVLALGSCIGLVSHPMLKSRFQKRARNILPR